MKRITTNAAIAMVILAALAVGCSEGGSPYNLSTVMVPMDDGVALATDIYKPTDGNGPWPVLLYRTPYGKVDDLWGLQENTSAGVVVVSQDMRGRYDSEGEDCVFTCDGDGEHHDGLDTFEWIVDQPWCNGKIATVGNSASAIVQYIQAPTDPPGLNAMWSEVSTPNIFHDCIFQGGVFRESLVEGWLGGQDSLFFLDSIAAHPFEDEFWDSVQTSDRYGSVNAPAVHWGGWFDIYAQGGNIDAFIGYQHQGGAGALGRQKLIVGPWAHTTGGYGSTTNEQGELVFPDNASDIPGSGDYLWELWFSHYLGLAPDQGSIDAVPPVQYYVMGDVDDPGAPGNEWRSADDWPPVAIPTRYYLGASGDLTKVVPGPATTGITYDPADPSPTIGGANMLIPDGPRDQSPLDARSDVLMLETPVLTTPLEVTGKVSAHLFVSIDQPDTDLMVRLADVYPDGRAMLVMDGAYRLANQGGASAEIVPLTSGQVVEAAVKLGWTSIIFNAGHKIRIYISSSNYPRFEKSSNNGLLHGESGPSNIVNVTLHHGTGNASFIELPEPEL